MTSFEFSPKIFRLSCVLDVYLETFETERLILSLDQLMKRSRRPSRRVTFWRRTLRRSLKMLKRSLRQDLEAEFLKDIFDFSSSENKSKSWKAWNPTLWIDQSFLPKNWTSKWKSMMKKPISSFWYALYEKTLANFSKRLYLDFERFDWMLGYALESRKHHFNEKWVRFISEIFIFDLWSLILELESSSRNIADCSKVH